MAYRLSGTKPLCDPMRTYYQSQIQEQTSAKFWSNLDIFLQENDFEYVADSECVKKFMWTIWRYAYMFITLRRNTFNNDSSCFFFYRYLLFHQRKK